MIKKYTANTLMITLLTLTTSACVPKKIEFGLNSETLSAVNQFADTAKDAVSKVKQEISNVKDRVKQKSDQVNVHNIDELQNRAVESIRDYSRSELGTLLVSNGEIQTLVSSIESAQSVECYSDEKEYLKYKKIEDQSYDFKMNLICLDGKTIPENASENPLADNANQSINGISAVIVGNMTWSKDAGLKITPNQEITPAIQVESFPLYSAVSFQKTLVRINPKK